MEVKRFFSSSMQDVLRMVREELGPDAVILSNTKVEGGMEVVAALDYDEDFHDDSIEVGEPKLHGEPTPSQIARMHAEKHIKLQKEMESARRKIADVKARRQRESDKERVLSRKSESVANKRSLSDESLAEKTDSWSELSDLRADIMEIKGIINSQPKVEEVHLTTRSKSIVQQQIEKSLATLCLSPAIQKELLNSLGEDQDFESSWRTISQLILSALPSEQEELIDRGGRIALVGPTGSGKTMTIGKMAARYVMKYGADNIALVTTDRYRIAAHEQLKVFGRILNVPVHTVDELNSLDMILDQLTSKKIVLIDTAGLVHLDVCWSEQLQELKMSSHPIQNYLVVSSVGQYQVMCSNYYNYKVVGLSGAIITKVDEAVSLGEVISFLIDTHLKAGYFTDGQRVPEDIHLFDREKIFEQAQSLLNSSERWVTISSEEESTKGVSKNFADVPKNRFSKRTHHRSLFSHTA